jgi:hypothetical protein
MTSTESPTPTRRRRQTKKTIAQPAQPAPSSEIATGLSIDTLISRIEGSQPLDENTPTLLQGEIVAVLFTAESAQKKSINLSARISTSSDRLKKDLSSLCYQLSLGLIDAVWLSDAIGATVLVRSSLAFEAEKSA